MVKQDRVTANVPEDLKIAARIKALQKRTTLSILIRKWMQRFVAGNCEETEKDKEDR